MRNETGVKLKDYNVLTIMKHGVFYCQDGFIEAITG